MDEATLRIIHNSIDLNLRYKPVTLYVSEHEIPRLLHIKEVEFNGGRWFYKIQLRAVKDGVIYWMCSRDKQFIDEEGEFYLGWHNADGEQEYIFFFGDEVVSIMKDIAPVDQWILVNPIPEPFSYLMGEY